MLQQGELNEKGHATRGLFCFDFSPAIHNLDEMQRIWYNTYNQFQKGDEHYQIFRHTLFVCVFGSFRKM